MSLMLVSVGMMPVCAQQHAGNNIPLFKLHAVTSNASPEKVGIRDSVWRYFSDQAMKAYLAKDYATAEKLYRAALQDALGHHMHDANLVLLMANLASTYRQEGKFNLAEPLFKQALILSNNFGQGPGSPFAYVQKQFAALLRQTGRDDSSVYALNAIVRGSAQQAQRPIMGNAKFEDFPEPDLSRQQARMDGGRPTNLSGRADNIVGTAAQGNGNGGDDPIVIDVTVTGLSRMFGQSASSDVVAHGRTTLTPGQIGSIYRSIEGGNQGSQGNGSAPGGLGGLFGGLGNVVNQSGLGNMLGGAGNGSGQGGLDSLLGGLGNAVNQGGLGNMLGGAGNGSGQGGLGSLMGGMDGLGNLGNLLYGGAIDGNANDRGAQDSLNMGQ